MFKVSNPWGQEINDAIDKTSMPQEFPNLPLGYMCNLIAWNYKSMSSFRKQMNSIRTHYIKTKLCFVYIVSNSIEWMNCVNLPD